MNLPAEISRLKQLIEMLAKTKTKINPRGLRGVIT